MLDSKPQQDEDTEQELVTGVKFAELEARSWEMELLLSGFVLYGLFALPKLINQWFIDLIALRLLPDDSILFVLPPILLAGIMFVISCLQVHFSIHLILRGFWIAVIGFRSLYTKRFNPEELDAGPALKSYLSRRELNLEIVIKKLNDASNYMFGMACFIALLGVSVSLFLGQFLLLLFLLSSIEFIPVILEIFMILGFLIMGLLLGADFLSGGWIRRRKAKWVHVPYFWIYWFFRMTTLSFLSDPIYYAILANRKYGSFNLIASLLLSGVLIIIFPSDIENTYFRLGSWVSPETKLHFQHYENLRKDYKSKDSLGFIPTIQQDIFTEETPYVRLFIPYVPHFTPNLKQQCPGIKSVFQNHNHMDKEFLLSLEYSTSNEVAEKEKLLPLPNELILPSPLVDENLTCLVNYYTVYINNKRTTSLIWRFFEHPKFTDESGIVTYIPLEHFHHGENTIVISRPGSYETPEDQIAASYVIPLFIHK